MSNTEFNIAAEQPPVSRNWSAPLWSFGVLALAWFTLSAVLITFQPLPEGMQHAFASLSGIPSMLAAAIAAAFAAARARGSVRRGWWLIAVAALCSAIGDGIWALYDLALGISDPFPSPADAFYLSVIPLFLVGIFLLSSARSTLGQFRTGLDAAVLLAAALAVGWSAIIDPTFAASEASTPQRVLSAAYPAADIVLLWALVVAVRRQRERRAFIVLASLTLGLTVFASGDLGFAYLSLQQTYASGAIVDLGWSAGFLLIACAAVLQTRWQSDLEPELGDRVAPMWRNAIPLGMLLALVGWVLVSDAAGAPRHDPVVILLVGAGLLGVTVRQIVVLSDNATLNASLDRRVRDRTRELQTTVDLTRDLASARTVDDVLAAVGGALRHAVGGEVTRVHRLSAQARQKARSLPEGTGPVHSGLQYDPETGVLVAGVGRPDPLGWVEVSGVSRPPHRTAAIEALVVGAGIAIENATLFDQARHDATHDLVTGLVNQRQFYDGLRAALDDPARGEAGVSVAVLDIDDFRLFNETYGRLQGDNVLKLVARVLRGRMPRGGIAARSGGDEFALLLPFGRSESVAFLSRLQGAIERVRIRLPQSTVPVRLSCGLSSFPEDGATAHALLVGAGDNVLHAKRTGVPTVTTPNLGGQTGGGNYAVLVGLITAIDRRDNYTREHCEMVSDYAGRLAHKLGLSSETQHTVAIAGMLHDVGKIVIPDHILRKPSRLTEDEYTVMKQHVNVAAGLIVDVPNRDEVVDGVVHHHERWDGTGYAKGLRGEAIPYVARIVSVVDLYSAMTLDRSYRKGLSPQAALEELRRAAGTQLDPTVTAAFIDMVEAESALGQVGDMRRHVA